MRSGSVQVSLRFRSGETRLSADFFQFSLSFRYGLVQVSFEQVALIENPTGCTLRFRSKFS